MKLDEKKSKSKDKLTMKDFDNVKPLLTKIVKRNEGVTIVLAPNEQGFEGFISLQNFSPMKLVEALSKAELFDEHELIAHMLSKHPHIIDAIIDDRRTVKKMLKLFKRGRRG